MKILKMGYVNFMPLIYSEVFGTGFINANFKGISKTYTVEGRTIYS